jgi:hypothetical protein
MNDSYQSVVRLDGRPCVVADHKQLPAIAQMANSYWCPLGPAFGVAWALLLKRDLDAIRQGDPTYHELTMAPGNRSDETANFPGLLFRRAQRLYPGAPDDDDSLYLVELVDRRYLVDRFSDTGALRQNLRSLAREDDYLTETGGYTWETSLAEIWNTMSAVLGSFPGLPAGASPIAQPENVRLTGENSWRVLNRMLQTIGCAARFDPLANAFDLVHLASSQTEADATTDADMLLDAAPVTSDAAEMPATIRVYFRNHYRGAGQEKDAELTGNWLVTGDYHAVDIATNISSAVMGTVLPLWDDLPRVLDEDNSVDNAGDLQARAQQRADDWINERRFAGLPSLRILPGIVTSVLPGLRAKVVLWRAWGPNAGATATEILRHTALPRRIVGGRRIDDSVIWESETGQREETPSKTTAGLPVYPRVVNVVQVNHGGASPGSLVSANSDGLHAGRVRRWQAGSMATFDDCWVLLVDDFDNAAGDVDAINGEFYGPARLCGIETSAGQTLPVYLARRGQNPKATRCRGLLKGALASSTATATVDNVVGLDGVSPTGSASATVAVQNTHRWEGDDDATCRFEWNNENQQWELYQVDCPA